MHLKKRDSESRLSAVLVCIGSQSAALVSESAVLAILADPSPTRRWVVRFYSTKASLTYTDLLIRCLASVRFTRSSTQHSRSRRGILPEISFSS